MSKEPRTMWKASITPDGKLWPEKLWISVDQETGKRLEDEEEFEFYGEIRNDPLTVPDMEFGKVYKFRSELNGIFSVFPNEEKK